MRPRFLTFLLSAVLSLKTLASQDTALDEISHVAPQTLLPKSYAYHQAFLKREMDFKDYLTELKEHFFRKLARAS